MRRMKTDKLDLVQFHWWGKEAVLVILGSILILNIDYDDEEYLNALKHLFELKNEGKIREVGVRHNDYNFAEYVAILILLL